VEGLDLAALGVDPGELGELAGLGVGVELGEWLLRDCQSRFLANNMSFID